MSYSNSWGKLKISIALRHHLYLNCAGVGVVGIKLLILVLILLVETHLLGIILWEEGESLNADLLLFCPSYARARWSQHRGEFSTVISAISVALLLIYTSGGQN